MSDLVLSLFPGGGMLDYAFEQEGYCIVRGPDVIWGGDVRLFHPPARRFEGIIGGPPCQIFSPIGNVNRARWGEDAVMPDLIPEFRRVVLEVEPRWWVMENSTHAYAPLEPCHRLILDNAWFGEDAERKRAFWSNLRLHVETPVFATQNPERAVSSCGSVDWKGSRAREPRRTLEDMVRLQGLPPNWLEHQPWTMAAKRKIVGNGVPIPMGRALARAIRAATQEDSG